MWYVNLTVEYDSVLKEISFILTMWYVNDIYNKLMDRIGGVLY